MLDTGVLSTKTKAAAGRDCLSPSHHACPGPYGSCSLGRPGAAMGRILRSATVSG